MFDPTSRLKDSKNAKGKEDPQGYQEVDYEEGPKGFRKWVSRVNMKVERDLSIPRLGIP